MQIDLQGLVEEFGIDKLPEESRKLVLGRILESIDTRVTLRMAEDLSDEQADQIGQLKEQDGEEALHKIEEIYPDFRKVYQEETDRIREEMRTLMPKGQ